MKIKFTSVALSFLLLFCFVFSANAAENTNSSPEFIRGVDISSYISLKNSGVSFRDYKGNILDDDGFFDFLKSCCINYVRLRIWNDPYDENGNGYGGGNCDIDTACKIGKLASKHGMKILADFHLSDFWADPSKQQAPKAWENFSLAQKQDAVYEYIYSSLNTLKNNGVNLGMVQVGNEINNGMCGETDYSNVCLLLKSGFDAVNAVDSKILRAVHYTDPQKNHFDWFADILKENNVDYDVFSTSYYSYWHGSTENLTAELKKISDKYDKYVMCAETAYPFTSEDSDFSSNTVIGNESDLKYPVNVYGQAKALEDVFNAVKSTGSRGIGVFYWEPAWITVGTNSYQENYELWEKYGSGWASSFSGEYSEDGAKWYGGSSWDNQALFDKNGNPLESLKVFSKFADNSLKGDVNFDGILNIKDATQIQKAIVKLVTFSEEQIKIADLNNDGTVSVADATLIQKKIVKII